MYQAVRGLSDQAYRRSARWPIGVAPDGAYLWGMTTYTTPHFATGVSDGNVRPAPTRARTASAAPYRTAGVTNEAALMAEGQTPDWQPGASKGVPKAAIGALGAALVGGVALAIVLMAPSNKVTKQAMPDPIAQAAATNAAAAKSADGTDAAVDQMDKQAPAAGAEPTTSQAASAAADTAPAAAVPAPVEAVVPAAPPVANAPVARAPKAHATPRVATPAPVVTPDTPDVPAQTVTPPADIQPPAMQQTPDSSTVSPSTPAPAPTPDTPAPTPAPAQ